MSAQSKNSEVEKQERVSMKKIGYEDIKKFVRLVEHSEINELEIIQDGTTLRIKKDSPREVIRQIPVENNLPMSVPVYSKPSEKETPTVTPPSETVVQGNYLEVKSPMVGTFYRAPSPDAEPFVRTGQVVETGKALCIIEAMKLMNEIESEYSGKIVKICVENARPVEFGQVLFLIEPV